MPPASAEPPRFSFLKSRGGRIKFENSAATDTNSFKRLASPPLGRLQRASTTSHCNEPSCWTLTLPYSPPTASTQHSTTITPQHTMSIPFSDIAKASNDITSKDFFHQAPLSVDVKTTAPNGVTFTSKAKSAGDKLSASLEGKYADKKTGLSLVQGWATNNTLSTKVELVDAVLPGLKTELVSAVTPNVSKSVKFNNYYTHHNLSARVFVDLLKGPVFNTDLSFTQDGITTGGALTYDVKSAKLNNYTLALGYKAVDYAVALVASNNLSVFTTGYFHKVSPAVQVGAKATYDSKSTTPNPVALEIASRYQLDPTAFVKAKVNDAGVVALAYQQDLTKGVKIGFGGAVDALKLNEATHKLGVSLSFSA
jgi:voltage-dependent anion channel protein 2